MERCHRFDPGSIPGHSIFDLSLFINFPDSDILFISIFLWYKYKRNESLFICCFWLLNSSCFSSLKYVFLSIELFIILLPIIDLDFLCSLSCFLILILQVGFLGTFLLAFLFYPGYFKDLLALYYFLSSWIFYHQEHRWQFV